MIPNERERFLTQPSKNSPITLMAGSMPHHRNDVELLQESLVEFEQFKEEPPDSSDETMESSFENITVKSDPDESASGPQFLINEGEAELESSTSFLEPEEIKREIEEESEEELEPSSSFLELEEIKTEVEEECEEELEPPESLFLVPVGIKEETEEDCEDPLVTSSEESSMAASVNRRDVFTTGAAAARRLVTGSAGAEAVEEEPLGTSGHPGTESSSNDKGHKPSGGAHYKMCKVCGKTFRSDYLPTHFRVHTRERPYNCKMCGKGFTFVSSLRRHALLHNREHFMCKECGKTFLSNTGLQKHSRTHKDFPHKCMQCGKTFACASYLPRHALTHNREHYQQCKECGMIFSDSSSLDEHVRRIHSDVPECEVCGKTFQTTAGLKMHARTHPGYKIYKCKSCGMTFCNGKLLRAHACIHTTERLVCNVVRKTFLLQRKPSTASANAADESSRTVAT